MLKWLIYVIFANICAVVCYITNPIVVLFADEEGELHGFWRYWQTWDDSLDVDFMVKEVVPSFLRYDFDSKYISGRENTPELTAVGCDKGCVRLRQGATFSTKERIQRYFCRVLWLTRNCSYGFAFWFFSVDAVGLDMKEVPCQTNRRKFFVQKDANVLTMNWSYKDDSYLCTFLGYDIYRKHFLGWKIDEENPNRRRYLIANRIALRFDKSEG